MTQQRIIFEWVLDDSKAELFRPPLGGGERRGLGLNSSEQRIVYFLLRGLVLLFIIVAAASGAGLTPMERQRREAQKGIALTLLVENQAWQKRDRELYESLIDPDINTDWEQAWRDYWRAGEGAEPDFEAKLLNVREENGYMQATVLTQQPAFEWWQTNPYREERFYRRIDQRWVRTVPPPSQWGETLQLTTKHLRFVYYARDGAAVEEAAPKLEKAYVGMYRALDLPDPQEGDQLISILPHPVGRWSTTVSQLEVTSPMLDQIPVGQSDGEYLAYDVMNWLTYRAVGDAVPTYGIRYLYRWPILVWGLRGWLRDSLLDQPSPWRTQAMQIVRDDPAYFLPVSLEGITDIQSNIHPSRQDVILRYLAAESLMTYVVDAYDSHHLAKLISALTHYSDWDDIIGVTFGVTVDEFESNWNAHLINEYELEDLIAQK